MVVCIQTSARRRKWTKTGEKGGPLCPRVRARLMAAPSGNSREFIRPCGVGETSHDRLPSHQLSPHPHPRCLCGRCLYFLGLWKLRLNRLSIMNLLGVVRVGVCIRVLPACKAEFAAAVQALSLLHRCGCAQLAGGRRRMAALT